MVKFTLEELFCEYCNLSKKWGVYLQWWGGEEKSEVNHDTFSKLAKIIPGLSFDEIVEDKKYLFFDTQEEAYKYFRLTDTKEVSQVVYSAICDATGCFINENT